MTDLFSARAAALCEIYALLNAELTLIASLSHSNFWSSDTGVSVNSSKVAILLVNVEKNAALERVQESSSRVLLREFLSFLIEISA